MPMFLDRVIQSTFTHNRHLKRSHSEAECDIVIFTFVTFPGLRLQETVVWFIMSISLCLCFRWLLLPTGSKYCIDDWCALCIQACFISRSPRALRCESRSTVRFHWTRGERFTLGLLLASCVCVHRTEEHPRPTPPYPLAYARTTNATTFLQRHDAVRDTGLAFIRGCVVISFGA